MEAEAIEECCSFLAQFLHEKTLTKLRKKYQDTLSATKFLEDLFDLICDHFTAIFGSEIGGCWEWEEQAFSKTSLLLRIPDMFTSAVVFQVSSEKIKKFSNAGKNDDCAKVCAIVSGVIRTCSLNWVLQVNQEELQTVEASSLEKSVENTSSFIVALLNTIDLMPFNAQQLSSRAKLAVFPRIIQLCHLVLEQILSKTNSQDDNGLNGINRSILKKISCKAVLTCIQEIGNEFWISDNSSKASAKFLEFMLVQCGYESVAELLSGLGAVKNNPDAFKSKFIFSTALLGDVLQYLKNFMAKHNLADSPVAIHILIWSIRKVKHPCLGQHVSMLLPPVLLLVDDFRVDNRVVGIETLAHIIENTNASELCWYGRADIIYDSLNRRVHTNEPRVMRALQPCLLKILKVIEPCPRKPIAGRTMNKCDKNFQLILSAMEYESKINMRRAYCCYLASFIDHMGITVVRHSNRLLRVIFGYLGIGDGESEEWRVTMMDILKCFIVNAWPRMMNHKDDILKCLMRLCIDISLSSVAGVCVKQQLFVKIEECLVLMLHACGQSVRDQLQEMTSGLGQDEMEKLINRALTH